MPGPTWAPTSSGGTSNVVQRCTDSRSTGSLVLRGPDAVGALEDAEVDAATPGRAGLDLQIRGASDRSASMSRYTADVTSCTAGRPSACTAVRAVAVVVPLEEVQRVLLDQRVQPFEEVGEDVRPGDVEHRAGSARSTRQRRPDPAPRSGCARTRSLSRLTISGSNQRPNSMPSPVTLSTKGWRPCGHTSVDHRPVAESGTIIAPGPETSRHRGRTARHPRSPRLRRRGRGDGRPDGRNRRPPTC